MEYSATIKYLRISPRKLRLVAESIRKLQPVEAVQRLKALPNRGGTFLADVISSVLANAKMKNADMQTLKFKEIDVMEGPVMKRWRPVSRGRAHGFKRRMSHVKVVVEDNGNIRAKKTTSKEDK